MKPHKHAELIKAWADGAEIEVFSRYHDDWIDCSHPTWEQEEYRIKPEPKPDVEIYLVKHSIYEEWKEYKNYCDLGNAFEMIRLIRDGETGKPKSAEVLK